MCLDKTSRIILKRSLTSGDVATIPPNEEHRSGLWNRTDIYNGEFLVNTADNRVFTRGDGGIYESMLYKTYNLTLNKTQLDTISGDNAEVINITPANLGLEEDENVIVESVVSKVSADNWGGFASNIMTIQHAGNTNGQGLIKALFSNGLKGFAGVKYFIWDSIPNNISEQNPQMFTGTGADRGLKVRCVSSEAFTGIEADDTMEIAITYRVINLENLF
jgi:hypothetical protein